MRNYVAKLKENSKKGFSLVELIIVIAIMAILVGIVASQVIPYMEKSRKSKDQQQLSSVTTAVVSAVSQADKAVGNIAGVQLGSLSSTGIEEDLTDLLGYSTLSAAETAIKGKFKSKAFGSKNIYVSYSSDGNTAGLAKEKGQVVTSVGSGSACSDKNMEAISE